MNVKVDETYQTGYEYQRTEPPGSNFAADFTPDLAPKQMLQLGVFGGNYFSTKPNEFPADWFQGVTLTDKAKKELNFFNINASQPLKVWQQKGWIYPEDPHGWFLWYCRYYQGRRIDHEDARQVRRWKNMCRHVSQVTNNCQPGDLSCRPRQRQALLHWAYDSRKL
jgi:hypothetical protein